MCIDKSNMDTASSEYLLNFGKEEQDCYLFNYTITMNGSCFRTCKLLSGKVFTISLLDSLGKEKGNSHTVHNMRKFRWHEHLGKEVKF